MYNSNRYAELERQEIRIHQSQKRKQNGQTLTACLGRLFQHYLLNAHTNSIRYSRYTRKIEWGEAELAIGIDGNWEGLPKEHTKRPMAGCLHVCHQLSHEVYFCLTQERLWDINDGRWVSSTHVETRGSWGQVWWETDYSQCLQELVIHVRGENNFRLIRQHTWISSYTLSVRLEHPIGMRLRLWAEGCPLSQVAP